MDSQDHELQLLNSIGVHTTLVLTTMSLSSFEKLPPETILAITKELRDETSALVNLALTNSNLLSFARVALYDNIELRAGHDDTEGAAHRSQKRFADVVANNTTLGPLVRNLSIRMRKMTFDCLPPSLHKLLAQGAFTRLKSLLLIEVDFVQAYELFAILEANRGLETLLISHTDIRSARDSTDAQTGAILADDGPSHPTSRGLDPHRVPLKTLVVRWPSDGWSCQQGAPEQMFLEKLDLTRLQVIELALEWPDQYTAWQPAIRAASSSIVTLRLTSGAQDEYDFPDEDDVKLILELLSTPLPSLRSLQLGYFSTGDDLCTYFMETVCTVLQSYPCPFPSLTELELTLTDRPDPATIDRLASEAEYVKWRSVTPELASSLGQALFATATSPERRYPHLERVRVRIRQQTYDNPYAYRARVPIPAGVLLWKFLTLDEESSWRQFSWWEDREEAAKESAKVLASWKTEIWESFAMQAMQNGVEFDIDILWDDPFDGNMTVAV